MDTKQLRSNVFLHACIPPLIIFIVTGWLLWLIDPNKKISLLLIVFLAGASGGVISNYLRIKDLISQDIGANATIQVYITPVIAGTLGWVAYAAFLTGIVEGPLFPKFSGKELEYVDIRSMFLSVKPAATLDAAKALLWAFIAGFSEKLIPNVLDKMAGKVGPEYPVTPVAKPGDAKPSKQPVS